MPGPNAITWKRKEGDGPVLSYRAPFSLDTIIGLLNSTDHWLMCGFIILLACLGKFGGSAVAARFTGSSWREAGARPAAPMTRACWRFPCAQRRSRTERSISEGGLSS